MKNFINLLILSVFMGFNGFLNATTIVPFEDLGEMARNTDLVVKVRVTDELEMDINNATRFWYEVEILSTVKGIKTPGEKIYIQNYHTKIGDLERTVWGDLVLEKDKVYLLFLSNMYDNVWQTTMLSYAAFEEVDMETEKVLVPFDLGVEFNFITPPGQDKAEKLEVYNSDKLVQLLSSVAKYEKSWNTDEAISRYNLKDIYNERMLPSHCTTLSGGANFARWEDIENTALPVYYHSGLDPGCTNTVAQIDNAIADINSNYTGLSLVNQGTHSYSPTCTGMQGSTDNEFTTYVSSTYGTTRAHLIQFDDPCDEIADLSGCSGTLAFGGLYWFSTTYTFNSMTWRRAAYGYVLVNNGTGACQCPSTDYEIMMTHELTHSLNIGHIGTGSGVANMNPSCCNSISTLDEECLDFIYAAPLPVELADYNAKLVESSVILDWSTYSEVNNDYFTIERKVDNGTYEVIGKIQGKGNSRNESLYEYIDDNPQAGNNYYRLSQIDFDGTKTVLGTKSVKVIKDFDVEVRPNPISNETLNLVVSSDSNNPAKIEIFQVSGDLVISQNRNLEEGTNFLNFTIPAHLNGLFMARVSFGNEVKVVKFVKN